ncbi:hypothetical protein E1A91_D12G287400v1 [Gossypium mustelinum]|uniref:Uncharacterized protein n=1 Tax=Gossypium mustelinum TaxID=34275 RepID=A0A5D2SLF5_GOSMU|nr:hypothetical protein E1A91_D12G287400v1 [Gossypium mustelinum]
MSNRTERYQKLCLEESLSRIYQYPIACKELSFILRGAYANLPKPLQSLVFQHTLTAIRLLPEMQTGSAVAAAHFLLQSAEAAFPKQKKSLVVTEFKQAKVAHKRRSKAHREEKGPSQLPQDVLVHIFCLLDLQSLISAGLVCRSNNSSRTKTQWSGKSVNKDYTFWEENVITRTDIDWKETFKRAYGGTYSKKLMSSRGYCGYCDTIVWLKNLKCSNRQCDPKHENAQIKPISPHQIVDYLMDGYTSVISSPDSDSESDEEPVSRLWAYPKDIRRIEKKPLV